MYKLDFVILGIGRWCVLNIPSFPGNKGPEVLQETVRHSIDYSQMGPIQRRPSDQTKACHGGGVPDMCTRRRREMSRCKQ
ncbi:hypothetical protein MUK42_33682 [Musa troglodytarum]|uniref:Uncharacterized protein n=1 Tax=Musa troglodytarum TaxID=320322 RepID=A0A9E7GRU4_9LILI|nr:hypothetical protein MUK42_33682 [Musa troglodytarum]